MYIIKSLKNLFFSHNDNELQLSYSKDDKEQNMILFANFDICFHKYIFKSNYKKKNVKKESNTEKKLNNKEYQNNNTIGIIIEELNEEKKEVNKRFFYILKGAIYVIEDWWKKILKKKENNNRILHRNFINKNYQIFSDKKNNKFNLSSSKYYEKYLKTDGDINNPKTINNFIKDKYQNNNNIFRNENKNFKIMQTEYNQIKNEIINQERNTLDETLINSDSCFFDFTTNNKSNKEKKIDFNKKISNSNNILTQENNKTKRENSIIYPIKEINLLIKKDIDKNQEKNNALIKKEIGQETLTIQWEEQNNKGLSKNSLEEKYELFKEVKSKMKLNNEVLSLMNNKYLLKENPFDESSIYINNSDLNQNELIRNVNVHIMPFEIKNISLKKYGNNNSNNSLTIQNDEDEIGSSVLSSVCEIDDNYGNNCQKFDNKNIIKKDDKNIKETKFDNINKN